LLLVPDNKLFDTIYLMNKKLLYALVALVVLLFIVIVVLVFAVLGKGKPGKQAVQNNQPVQSSELKFDNEAVSTDPIGDPRGPFYHDLYVATSPDGLTFSGSKKILEHASVPDIIKLPDGRIAVYAVEAARRSLSGLLVSISEDEGKSWKSGSVRFTSSLVGGADPEVILTDEGKIRLYFITFGQRPGGKKPDPNNPDPNIKNVIKSALSTDGINFTMEEGSRFEYPLMTDPDVIKIGSKWFAYISEGRKNIAISSSDSLSFKLEKTIRENGSVSNTVALGDGRFRQFYCGMGINSALTTDGLRFTNEVGNRVSDAPAGSIICDPAPIKVSGGWIMVYKVAKQ